MPDPDERELRITDPRALRALAHPARQRVITELFSGEVLTATQAGRLCGLSASAMSYHLRALERWGIVEREPSADARERPWRATADSITITPEAHRGAGGATSRTSIRQWFGDLDADLERMASAVGEGETHGMTSRGRLWMTDAEERELQARLGEVVSSYRGRTSRDHPEGARPWNVYALILPGEAHGS
ncbi:helix-turn-helix transcriptional regulator [Phycicoccus endophyticus]|uniref:Helix-turn-helix transcriptional regulator n=1 Tax=Phycicoccus endophyticus TaxID=1690220 RepID=A0A7G9R085_9MICO|nr:helix-turn-helix domain-containing protein [Phycicoccus endophyticus]NHI20192.1 helix-turn-helix transcriptional regulator [Phycicoccus endophyticus]QNN49010.1 helix-turn-helix transcriptional regulator [Phycicoccus endophyticus]GGL44570.1 transcriptional regulator [Phycicoccus endophyticus]